MNVNNTDIIKELKDLYTTSNTEIPLIVLSVEADEYPVMLTKYAALGFDFIITKPFDT